MPPEERDVIVLAKLREQVRYAYRNSGFYREFYADAPVDPDNLQSLKEFAQLPILTKEDIRHEQEEHPPSAASSASGPTESFESREPRAPPAPTVFGIGKTT